MAGSRRTKRRKKPVVIRRGKKDPFTKSKLPKEIRAGQAPDLEKKLGRRAQWSEQDTLPANYQRNRFMRDANAAFGRQQQGAAPDPLGAAAAALGPAADDPRDAALLLDDDLRAACALERAAGKAPPRRPTPRQRAAAERLVAAHGADLEAMVADSRLNPWLHSAATLARMIEAAAYYAGDDRAGFRAPVKSLA